MPMAKKNVNEIADKDSDPYVRKDKCQRVLKTAVLDKMEWSDIQTRKHVKTKGHVHRFSTILNTTDTTDDARLYFSTN